VGRSGYYSNNNNNNNNSSVALVRKRTIPTERPPLVGEVSTNFCGQKGVVGSARRIPYGRNLGFLDRAGYNREKHLASPGNRTPTIQPVAISTERSWLPHIIDTLNI
jgi:hypothetical protein